MTFRSKVFLGAFVTLVVGWLLHPFWVRNLEAVMEERGWDQTFNQIINSLVGSGAEMPGYLGELMSNGFWWGAFLVLAIWGTFEIVYVLRRRRGPVIEPPTLGSAPSENRDLFASKFRLWRTDDHSSNWYLSFQANRSFDQLAVCIEFQHYGGKEAKSPYGWFNKMRHSVETLKNVSKGQNFVFNIVQDSDRLTSSGDMRPFILIKKDEGLLAPSGPLFARCSIVIIHADVEQHYRFVIMPSTPDCAMFLVGQDYFDWDDEFVPPTIRVAHGLRLPESEELTSHLTRGGLRSLFAAHRSPPDTGAETQQ